MKPLKIRCSSILLAAMALIACSPISAEGPTTWIDRPLDGEQIPLGPLTIQAHAADAGGISRFEFLTNSAPLANVPSNGDRFTEASAGWMPPAPGTYTIGVRAVNGRGAVGQVSTAHITVAESTPTPPFTAPPSEPLPVFPSEVHIIFGADRTNLKPGECANLVWNVDGPAEMVQLANERVNRSGQTRVCPQLTTTYTLIAGAGASGSSKQSDVVISVGESTRPPACLGAPEIGFFTANPNAIAVGQSTILSWGAITNATSATIDNGVGAPAMSGGRSAPLSLVATTTYTLIATGCGGTTTKQVTVVVSPAQPPAAQPPPPQQPVCPGPPVIEFFNANPSTITAGQSSRLSWGTVTNATSAVIDPDVGGVPTPGSATVSPGTTRTYTLTATGCGGTMRRQATITVNAAPPAPPPPVQPPKDTTPPAVSNVGANPTSLVKDGTGCTRTSRTTTVTATVTDAGGVNRVVARVLGTGIEVNMGRTGGNSYQAVVGPFNTTGNLSIVISAWDNAGNAGQGGPVSVLVQPCIQ